jgi:hypothetical protein
MTGFIEGECRSQATLFPERLDDYIAESSLVRVIDVFVDELDLESHRFKTVPEATKQQSERLQDKITRLREEVKRLKTLEKEILNRPDQQISLTDPDARSMATSGRGTGMVGYNMQTAVDTKHHMIVTHEVTNEGHDRSASVILNGLHKTMNMNVPLENG